MYPKNRLLPPPPISSQRPLEEPAGHRILLARLEWNKEKIQCLCLFRLPRHQFVVRKQCYRTFLHKQSGKEFSVALPIWNSYPEWIVMKHGESDMLLILSSGNWKRGEDVYLGFVEIKI